MILTFEAGKEAIIYDVHPEPVQLLDRSKDQSEELIEFNLTEEGKEAQSTFVSASFFLLI